MENNSKNIGLHLGEATGSTICDIEHYFIQIWVPYLEEVLPGTAIVYIQLRSIIRSSISSTCWISEDRVKKIIGIKIDNFNTYIDLLTEVGLVKIVEKSRHKIIVIEHLPRCPAEEVYKSNLFSDYHVEPLSVDSKKIQGEFYELNKKDPKKFTSKDLLTYFKLCYEEEFKTAYIDKDSSTAMKGKFSNLIKEYGADNVIGMINFYITNYKLLFDSRNKYPNASTFYLNKNDIYSKASNAYLEQQEHQEYVESEEATEGATIE